MYSLIFQPYQGIKETEGRQIPYPSLPHSFGASVHSAGESANPAPPSSIHREYGTLSEK